MLLAEKKWNSWRDVTISFSAWNNLAHENLRYSVSAVTVISFSSISLRSSRFRLVFPRVPINQDGERYFQKSWLLKSYSLTRAGLISFFFRLFSMPPCKFVKSSESRKKENEEKLSESHEVSPFLCTLCANCQTKYSARVELVVTHFQVEDETRKNYY